METKTETPAPSKSNGNGTHEEKIQRIPLGQCEIPSYNTRQPKPNDPGIIELANSIKITGQTTPAIARQHPKKKGFFEIGAGARRLVACGVAQIPTLAVVVREYDDSRFEELILVENLQREDPDPKAEAELMDRLVKRGVHTAAQISAHLGKPEHWVVRRLQLLKVIPELRKEWQEGRIQHFSVDMLSLLGALPVDTQKALVTKNQWSRKIEVACDRCESRAELEKFIGEQVSCRLDNAPFDLNDQCFFVKGCGPGCACDSSMFAGLFDSAAGKKDEAPRCLRPECFKSRLQLANKAKIADFKKEHGDLPYVTPEQSGHSHNQKLAFFGKDVSVHSVESWNGEKLLEKETKGAQKVICWNPARDSLVVKWLSKTRASSSGKKKEPLKNTAERMKERKAILQGKRWTIVHEELAKALAISSHVHCTGDIVDLVAVFGLPYKAEGYRIDKTWSQFDARKSAGFPFQAFDHRSAAPKAKGTDKDRLAVLWHGLKIVLADTMRPFGNVGDVPEKVPAMRRVAALIKFPIDERKKEADKTVPPPRSWGAVDIHTLEPVKGSAISAPSAVKKSGSPKAKKSAKKAKK